jgi:hypothetical protein
MMQKTGSGKHKTSYPDPDATEFVHDREEYSAPDLPERLSNPMRVDLGLLARIDAARKAGGPVGEHSVWSRWYDSQVEELRGRWMALFDFYKIAARSPEDAWMQLATVLARDFVPGLLVENVFPTQDLLIEQARLFTLITEVSEAVRARRGEVSDHVSERAVLEEDFFNEQPWNAELFGKKPDSIDTLVTRFAREKERFARLLIEQYWSKAAIMSFFADSGLEAPEFIADLPA